MKRFLNSIFQTTEERIRNPFIGAFLTSWIVFNWKPIFYIVFSQESIKDKIIYVDDNFNDIWYYLYFPLIASIFYILILPYINLIFEGLLKYSVTKRNESLIQKKIQIIEDEKKIAIEELKREEAKTQFRERNTHNKLVDELQKQIEKQNEELAKSREAYQVNLNELKQELFEKDQSASEELKRLRERLDTTIREKYKLQDELLSRENDINSLTTELEMNNSYNRNDITFDDGVSLRKTIRDNQVLYYDDENGKIYSENEVKRKMKNQNYNWNRN